MGGRQADINIGERWYKGEDRKIDIDVDQSDDSTPEVMSGWTLTWELYDDEGGTVLLSKTTGAGEITIVAGDGASSVARVAITDEDTEALDAGWHFHLLRRTDAGSERVLAFGNALLIASGFS